MKFRGQTSLFRVIALHFLPGVLVLAAYALLGGVLVDFGIPPAFTLHLLFAGVSIPYITVFLRRNRDDAKNEDFRFTTRLAWWKYALLVPAFLVYAIVASALFAPVSTTIASSIATFVPSWYASGLSDTGPLSVPFWLVVAVALLIDGIANPIAEELYFRGYLLPRLRRVGLSAPLIHGVLFAAVHLWQPQNIPLLIVLVVPLYYAVWYFRSVYLSIAVHCAANIIGVMLMVGSAVNSTTR